MQFVHQTNPSLHADIRGYGCNFRVLQAIAEVECGRFLTIEEINQLYADAQSKKWVTAKCWVQDNAAITNAVFAHFGSSKRLSVIGDFPLLANAIAKGNYVRPRWQTNRTASSDMVHFTLSNINGHIFDPYNALEATYALHNLKAINYRAFKVV